MKLRRIIMVHQPTRLVWHALRDELPSVATHMGGIASIQRLESRREPGGIAHTVHEWTAIAGLPRAIEERADAKALTWIERATWFGDTLVSRWTVESHVLGRSLTGSGETRLATAMGGRGTRVQFDVTADIESGTLGPLATGALANGIVTAATTVLAKTLQDLCVAVETFLGTRAQ